MKLQRQLSQWSECVPEEMAKMSPAAIQYALSDAKEDILTLAKLLCEAGYPRRGTAEEIQNIYAFAQKVQTLITHADALKVRYHATKDTPPTQTEWLPGSEERYFHAKGLLD